MKIFPVNIATDFLYHYDICELCNEQRPFVNPVHLDMVNQETFKGYVDHVIEDIEEFEYETKLDEYDSVYVKTLKNKLRASKLRVKDTYTFKELFQAWCLILNILHQDSIVFYKIKNYFELRDLIKEETER